MSDNEKYNGWTNRETWAVALHINNDQGWQASVHEALREQRRNHEELPGEVNALDAREAGDTIHEIVDEFVDPTEGHLSHHQVVMTLSAIGSLWRVNWTELGASFLAAIDASDAR